MDSVASKTSIEALFDIVSGMELAADEKTHPYDPKRPDFTAPLHFFILDEDVECVLADSTLVKALEDADLRGLVNYIRSFKQI